MLYGRKNTVNVFLIKSLINCISQHCLFPSTFIPKLSLFAQLCKELSRMLVFLKCAPCTIWTSDTGFGIAILLYRSWKKPSSVVIKNHIVKIAVFFTLANPNSILCFLFILSTHVSKGSTSILPIPVSHHTGYI